MQRKASKRLKPLPFLAGGDPPAGVTVSDGLERIVRIAHAHNLADSAAWAQNGLLFWGAYLQARAANLPLHEYPDGLLETLDRVAQGLLSARSSDEVLRAVMLERPRKGGPGPTARAEKNYSATTLGGLIWAAHLRISGRSQPESQTPQRLARGTYKLVQRSVPEMSTAALKMAWQRYKEMGVRPSTDDLASLQWPPKR